MNKKKTTILKNLEILYLYIDYYISIYELARKTFIRLFAFNQ